MAGLFDFGDFSFKNVLTMPFDIAKNDLSFFNEFRKDPKGAFGRKQKGMTEILGGVGFNKDNKINKNSDGIMATILGGIVAGGAMGAGAGGAGQAGAGAGSAAGGTGQVVGQTAGQTAGTTAQSGSWLNNPYVQQGQNLLQQKQAQQQQLMAQTQQQNQMPRSNVQQLLANQEQQGYTPYGRGGLLG